MKHLIRSGIEGTIDILNIFRLSAFLGNVKREVVYFIDIDNTIADTWPTFRNLKKYKNEHHRHLELPILPGSHKYVKEILSNPENKVIFLTARYFTLHFTTAEWLSRQQLSARNALLIVVDSPKAKLKFISRAVAKGFEVVYMDDLSYGHEKGQVRFYEDVLLEISKMNVKYIGYSDIRKLNESC